MSVSPYAALIIQQVEEKCHTVANVEEMKRCHEQLYGNDLNDPDYASVCEALAILQQREETQ